jgi:hypothetical protein
MPFGSLWLQVVVAAVAVFVLSAIAHMVLKYHKADFRKLPDEDGVAAALRKAGAPQGSYMLPYCSDNAQFKDPAFLKRFEDGPVAIVTMMRSGAPNLAKHLALWFGFCFLASFTTAYVARHTLTPGADDTLVLQITGTVAFIAYGYGAFQNSIWHGVPWSNAFRALIDALVYGLATGAVFCWMWPAA